LLLDFFELFASRLILTLLNDFLNQIVINVFSFWGTWFMRKEVKSAAAVGLRCKHKAPVHCLVRFLFAEALDRWDGKTKHHLISYFLSNTSAKNYHNRIVYVKIIASQRWNVFWDTVYITLCGIQQQWKTDTTFTVQCTNY